MKLGFGGGVALVLIVAALIVGYSSLFTVYQTQQALVVRLGNPVRVVSDPGLHVKLPFVDTVIAIDRRILDLEAPAQEVIASDQKRLVVDAFARYRIKEPLRFYQTLGSIQGANSQLAILLNSALRRVLGEVTFTHVVRDQRADLMARIRGLVSRRSAMAELDEELQFHLEHEIAANLARGLPPEEKFRLEIERSQQRFQRGPVLLRQQLGGRHECRLEIVLHRQQHGE